MFGRLPTTELPSPSREKAWQTRRAWSRRCVALLISVSGLVDALTLAADAVDLKFVVQYFEAQSLGSCVLD